MRAYLLATIFLFACTSSACTATVSGGGSSGQSSGSGASSSGAAGSGASSSGGTTSGGPSGDICEQDWPRGTAAELTIMPGAQSGPRIDPPEFCSGEGSAEGAYIRVYGSGTRQIAMGQEALDRGACTEPPPPGSPASVCPEIFADAIGEAVLTRLMGEGLFADGIGLGVCGMPAGLDPDVWRFSVGVHDWKDADAGVRAIDAELTRWGAGDSLGLSVRGIDCAQEY